MGRMRSRFSKNMHTSSGGSAKNAGFTLIELMVVVAIIGLVVAIALPSFFRMTRSADYGNEFRAMRSAFSDCRAQAIEFSRPASMPVVVQVRSDGIDCFVWQSINDEIDSNIFTRDFTQAQIQLDQSILPPDRRFVVTNAGYFVSTTRETTVARLWIEDVTTGEPAWFEVFPSGQMRGQ